MLGKVYRKNGKTQNSNIKTDGKEEPWRGTESAGRDATGWRT